ncbi:hypothetical protein ZHAS_00004248 [Anopheles sinensis]|uniref:Uncharacterized protein n=1 Tax=Anopheles sinensis TaxID=74873 RepID=A0A084VGF1_ANOSI|nr:hypothetical protein ZHAS_00004248 [Anopheles sinensis]
MTSLFFTIMHSRYHSISVGLGSTTPTTTMMCKSRPNARLVPGNMHPDLEEDSFVRTKDHKSTAATFGYHPD